MKKREVHLERVEISEVAATLFAEKGFVGTSMRDIAKALNVSVASVYYYFKNKESILFNIIEAIGNKLLIVLRKAKSESDSPLEQMRMMLFCHVCLTKENRYRVKVYVEEQHNLSPRLRKIIYKQHREIYDCYVDQLRELQKSKVISREPLFITAFAIFGMLNWCYRWFREDGDLSIEDVAERLTGFLLHGILAGGQTFSSGQRKMKNAGISEPKMHTRGEV